MIRIFRLLILGLIGLALLTLALANRGAVPLHLLPEDLAAQIAPLHACVRALGWPLLMSREVRAALGDGLAGVQDLGPKAIRGHTTVQVFGWSLASPPSC